MSASLALLGIVVPDSVAELVIGALVKACAIRQPIGRFAMVVTPEAAYLTARVELVDQFHGLGLHGLAAKIARRPTRGDDLLIVATGDEAPRLVGIPLAKLRIALASVGATRNDGDRT